jgi:hypothetical protein
MADSFPRAYWNDTKIDRQICDYGDTFPHFLSIGANQSVFSSVDQFGPHDIDHVGSSDENEGRGRRKKRSRGRRY